MREKLRSVRFRIAEKVRQLRNFRGLSQEALAEKVGNTPVHMSLVERGKTNVTIDVLTMIADKLSVDVSELVVPSGRPKGERIYVVSQHDLEEIMQAAEHIVQVIKRIRQRGGRRMREHEE